MNKIDPKILISTDVYLDILLETEERIDTETGGLFLGQIIDNNWIILEVVDPGIDAKYSSSIYEYDREYQKHVANKIARRYNGLKILGLWHRHPGTFNDFSRIDLDTFRKFTIKEKRGILSGLVNISPKFQLTMYFVDENIHYHRLEYQIKDINYLNNQLKIKRKTIGDIEDNINNRNKIKNFISKKSLKYEEIPILPISLNMHEFDELNIKNLKEPVVYIPIDYVEKKYYGKLFGFYHHHTNQYNILYNKIFNSQFLGEIVKDKINLTKNGNILQGYYEKDNIILKTKNDVDCIVKRYSFIKDIFSRNAGIIESHKMLDKKILIAGCGSVGSYIAIELTKIGIGNFILVDNDIFSYDNICRHQCGIPDVGRYKVEAVAEKIKLINFNVNIEPFPDILQNLTREDFEHFNKIDIIISAADNRETDIYANKISQLLGVPLVTIGLWERGFAGEIFYSIPGETSCYSCIFAEKVYKSGRVSKNRHLYSLEDQLLNFEPGISLDINFVSNIGLKIILDLLNKSDISYKNRILDDLNKNYVLVCNSKEFGGEWNKVLEPLQVIKVGTEKKDNCQHCSLKGKFY